MAFVIITYPNGTVLSAIVLSHDERDIRAAAPGFDDVLALTCIHGAWVSEDGHPVTVEFAWQRSEAAPIPAVDDCICSKELAARVIQTMFGGGEDEATLGDLAASSPGTGVGVRLTELRLN